MKKTIFILFLLLGTICLSQNKKIAVNLQQSVPLQADNFIGMDNLGFFYYSKDNVFYKQKDTESWEYKNISLGKISDIDILNPLKIILFYENFNTVVLLDNQLNETQKINFSENQNQIVVSKTGIASQNRLWIYDSMNQQIGLYDYLNAIYKPISVSFPENMNYFQSDFNTFNWIDQKNNWYTIDVFGKIMLKGTIPDFDSVIIINSNEIIYSKNNILFFFRFDNNNSILNMEIEISEKSFKKFYYKDQILSIFTQQGITNYKIITP